MRRNKKSWRDRLDIDAGLPDQWIESVNSLCIWAVGSTCEGHPHPLQSLEYDHALIALCIRAQYMRNAIESIVQSPNAWEFLVKQCFDRPDTYVSLRCENGAKKQTIAFGRKPDPAHDYSEYAFPDITEEFDSLFSDIPKCNLEIHHTAQRTTELIPQLVLSWLNRISDQLHVFDHESKGLLEK